MEQLRSPVMRLGFDMFRATLKIVDDEEGINQNFVVGIFAAAAAAGLIYVGSGGKTADKLASILHFDKLFEARCTPELITIAFRQAVAHLTKRADEHFPLHDMQMRSPFQLVLAHRAFFRKGLRVTTEFFHNAKSFSVDVGEIAGMDDDEDFERLRSDINTWVQRNTRGQITEALPPLTQVDHSEELTNMFLISVTSVRGRWQQAFTEQDVQLQDFTNLDGTRVRTPFLTCEAMHLPYYQEGRLCYQYLEIPYANNEASLCLILPCQTQTGKRVTLSELVKRFSLEDFKNMGIQKTLRKVDVRVPVFEIDHTFDLKDFFGKLGVNNPENADLSRIVNEPVHNFRLTGAYHKCSFGINENGTSAEFFNEANKDDDDYYGRRRANSGDVAPVRRSLRSTATETVTFHADRPFIFCVRHNLSGMILFIGRVVDLSAAEQTRDLPVKQSATTPLKALWQKSKDWLENETGLIGRKRTGSM
ncbi:leukocyte elastase inhibitor A-like [Paramacrobiotus metropolitanus]|uniref:leukocyte elastase inhibitor A-like n=1 Tax=Paramacrobiotus metropolitanus TaxID=2943436 RepID=UPI0024460F5E|nr:leukocyte elastase inhibitor A-like [Paramacrobiotus metropolitanus]